MFKRNFLSTTMTLLTLAGVGLGITASYAAVGTVAHVASGRAVLRTGPAKAYTVIATVPTGEKVQINGCLSNKSWCSLRYNGRVGWASARYLNANHVPTIFFADTRVKQNSVIKAPKEKAKHVVSRFKNLKVPQKTRKNVQKMYRTDLLIDSTGVKGRGERTIFNPSQKARGVSVKHVTAYNPFFSEDVNFRNFERNETRYRIVTYPAP
ncbi:uncharacterized protein YraI [Bartonella callosciuri]|uniref:Uncharacterized protein YraI n=1 Tax=Bartonella callosciuri TaxID=686223 RepID=A0A840NVF5_9HYPH|nr:SH3 domain-containing protein [Bartonella callosciuri]MBB5073925.1 uncharacterized protein YraI [Bartonella callosciuri]